MKLLRLLALGLAVAALAPATSAAPAANRSSPCTGAATMTLIRTFVRGYGNGRVAAINRLWAPKPRFRWFSSGPPGTRLGPPAYERSTLATYFRSRVRVHERLRLTYLRTPGYDPRRKVVDFAGKLVRSADDMRPHGPTDFKGAADCVSGGPTLIVWSM